MSISIHSSTRSASQASSRRSHRSNTNKSTRSNQQVPPPGPSLTPSHDGAFEACAATASFFLYAQRNIILCLHHDTLAIERRFERHKEDVQLISVDNISDQGGGRLVVSYDSSQTTIVWDLLTGNEVARFASYEEIRVAVWMRNANIAFGNSQGNVILFEPSTSEHISARTIFDPITALAPSSDCRTFAIGYMNGSILIANLQPAFTILHTLSTNRPPSPLNKLAWHGSSSKQKSDMLAAQSVDGDLRVWSIPKTANGDTPSIIRVLSRSEDNRIPGANWFGWSKMGRIIQYSEGLTFVWDVRTKRVTYESVPTVDGLVGITNYGPTASLFTLGRNHTVQQYDLNPSSRPTVVQNVQHVPAKLPPSPPISDGDLSNSRYVTAGPSAFHQLQERNTNLPLYLEVDVSSSEGEGEMVMSPLQRIAKDLEQMDEERDIVGPLSPVSSHSSVASRSSRGTGRKHQKQAELPYNPTGRVGTPSVTSSSTRSTNTATTFSAGSSAHPRFVDRALRESISTRSLLSTSTHSSSQSRPSHLRQEVFRAPDETENTKTMDLFPFTRARLADIPFRAPQYDQNRRTPDDLRVQMLDVVFGWPDDIELLIRDELSRHPAGSASGVMLSKWLGELGADFAASMIGSESMTSSDWMLLALSNMGADSQKKVGEAFVQRLLEKGDIHPAAAILLGLGEYDDAVEVYVSRKYYMEAVLLTCLFFPTDWQRQSFLVRKWGEVAVTTKQTELAVRCFSCTSMESSEPWFSPRAQDAVYAMQQNILAPDTPISKGSSPASPSANPRLHPMMAGLKLVTNFNKAEPGPRSALDEKTPMVYAETPIDIAMTPGGLNSNRPFFREPASARTATPGGYNRKRFPSATRIGPGIPEISTPQPTTAVSQATPMTALKSSSRAPSETASSMASSKYRGRSASASQAGSSMMSTATYQPSVIEDRGRSGLPSPAIGVFARLRQESAQGKHRSRERKPEGLSLNVDDVVIDHSLPSGVTGSQYTNITQGSASVHSQQRRGAPSPPLLTGGSLQSSKVRSIDAYINSLEEANNQDRSKRGASRAETERRPASRTTTRAPSESRSTRYVQPAKRSPSSPVSMSPDDPALLNAQHAFDDERFYQVTSPAPPSISRARKSSRPAEARATSRARRGESTSGGKRAESTSGGQRMRSRSRAPTASRQNSAEELQAESRGRSRSNVRVETRSPSSPRPMSPAESTMSRSKVGERVRERSMSRRPRSPQGSVHGSVQGSVRRPSPDPSTTSRKASRSRMPKLQTDLTNTTVNKVLEKRALAAQELEARRLSLARQPSAPPIVHPDTLIPKSAIDPTQDPNTYFGSIPSELELIRGHTADPHALRKLASTNTGTSSRSVPIGLPATPRAMRHPKYMGAENGENVPAVPQIPGNFAQDNNGGTNSNNEQQEQLLILPSSTFSPRSASAPPEKYMGHRTTHERKNSNGRPSHSRQNSGNEVTVVLPNTAFGGATVPRSIDETLREHDDVIIIENTPEEDPSDHPAILPELQHLAGPSPPPPPPPPMIPPPPPQQPHQRKNSLGVINIGIQEENGRQGTPNIDQQRQQEANPAQTHRRGRGSVGGVSDMSQKFRSVRDRLRDRSASRNRTIGTISPPVPAMPTSYTPAPYESMPRPIGGTEQPNRQPQPTFTQPNYNNSNVRSAYETPVMGSVNVSGSAGNVHNATQSNENISLLLPSTTYGGYRNPKDIARQMTQEQVQFGAEVPDRAGAQSVPAMPTRSSSVYQGYKSRELRANMPPGQLQFGVEQHPDGSGRI